MRTGKHKESFYAACFVLVPHGKKSIDEKTGEEFVELKENRREAKELDLISRKREMAYWSTVSEDDAISGLNKTISEKGFQVDEFRTASDELMELEKMISVKAKQAEEKKLEEEKKA